MLAPFECEPDRLKGLLAHGDEAARRMAQYLATDADKRALYSDEMCNAIGDASTEALTRELYASCTSTDPLNRSLFVDFETLLPDQVLLFVDRLSMAHSVEVRPPFLDHRLVELVANLPGCMKIKRGRVKNILKDAVQALFPEGLVDRPKEGFVMPINDWILDKLETYVRASLSPQLLRRHECPLKPTAIADLLGRYYAGEMHLASRIWIW